MSAVRYRFTIEVMARPSSMLKRGDTITVILRDQKMHAAVITHPRRAVLDDNDGERVMALLTRGNALIDAFQNNAISNV